MKIADAEVGLPVVCGEACEEEYRFRGVGEVVDVQKDIGAILVVPQGEWLWEFFWAEELEALR